MSFLVCTTGFGDDDGDPSVATPDFAVTVDDLPYFLVQFEAGDVTLGVDNGASTGAPVRAVTVDNLLYVLIHFEIGC